MSELDYMEWAKENAQVRGGGGIGRRGCREGGREGGRASENGRERGKQGETLSALHCAGVRLLPAGRSKHSGAEHLRDGFCSCVCFYVCFDVCTAQVWGFSPQDTANAVAQNAYGMECLVPPVVINGVLRKIRALYAELDRGNGRLKPMEVYTRYMRKTYTRYTRNTHTHLTPHSTRPTDRVSQVPV